jgi:hypothetical protein
VRPAPEPLEQPVVGPDGELLEADTTQVDTAAYAAYVLGDVHQVPRRDWWHRWRWLFIILAGIVVAVLVAGVPLGGLLGSLTVMFSGLLCVGCGWWLFGLGYAVLRFFNILR